MILVAHTTTKIDLPKKISRLPKNPEYLDYFQFVEYKKNDPLEKIY